MKFFGLSMKNDQFAFKHSIKFNHHALSYLDWCPFNSRCISLLSYEDLCFRFISLPLSPFFKLDHVIFMGAVLSTVIYCSISVHFDLFFIITTVLGIRLKLAFLPPFYKLDLTFVFC